MIARRKMVVGVGVAAVLAAASMLDARGFRRYLSMKQELNALSEKNREMAESNRHMAREVDSLRSGKAALERAAREELGFIKPGEVIINVE